MTSLADRDKLFCFPHQECIVVVYGCTHASMKETEGKLITTHIVYEIDLSLVRTPGRLCA